MVEKEEYSPFKWKCHICGKESNYISKQKPYCQEHWDIYLESVGDKWEHHPDLF